MRPPLTTVNEADRPLNFTLVAPEKDLPVIVTGVSTMPSGGRNASITGGCVTRKSIALVAVPSGVVTLIRPVLAPAGTVVRIRVPETTVKPAGVPLKRTLLVPEKPAPVT